MLFESSVFDGVRTSITTITMLSLFLKMLLGYKPTNNSRPTHEQGCHAECTQRSRPGLM
jgi:hypothetical protein